MWSHGWDSFCSICLHIVQTSGLLCAQIEIPPRRAGRAVITPASRRAQSLQSTEDDSACFYNQDIEG